MYCPGGEYRQRHHSDKVKSKHLHQAFSKKQQVGFVLFSCPGTEASCQRKVMYHRPRDDEEDDDDDELLRWEKSLYFLFSIVVLSDYVAVIAHATCLFPVFQARQ